MQETACRRIRSNLTPQYTIIKVGRIFRNLKNDSEPIGVKWDIDHGQQAATIADFDRERIDLSAGFPSNQQHWNVGLQCSSLVGGVLCPHRAHQVRFLGQLFRSVHLDPSIHVCSVSVGYVIDRGRN